MGKFLQIPEPDYSIAWALLSWLQTLTHFLFSLYCEHFLSQIIDCIGYVSLRLPIFKKGEAVYLS